MKPDISHFDKLPNAAMVPVATVGAVFESGVSTVWRRARNEPNCPQPVRLGAKCTRWRVGDIRAFIEARAAK